SLYVRRAPLLSSVATVRQDARRGLPFESPPSTLPPYIEELTHRARRFDRFARRCAEECDYEVAIGACRDGRRDERRLARPERTAVRIHGRGHIDSLDIDDRPGHGHPRGKCPRVAGGLPGPGDLVIEPLRQREVLRRVAVAPNQVPAARWSYRSSTRKTRDDGGEEHIS